MSSEATELDKAKKKYEQMVAANRAVRLPNRGTEVDPNETRFVAVPKKTAPIPAEWLKMQEEARAKLPVTLPISVEVRKAESMVEEQKIVKLPKRTTTVSTKSPERLSEEASKILSKDRTATKKLTGAAGFAYLGTIQHPSRREMIYGSYGPTVEAPGKKEKIQRDTRAEIETYAKSVGGIVKSIQRLTMIMRAIIVAPNGQHQQVDRPTVEEIHQYARNLNCEVQHVVRLVKEKDDKFLIVVYFEGNRSLTFKAEDAATAEREAKSWLLTANSDGAALRATIFRIEGEVKLATFTRREMLDLLPAPSADVKIPSRKRGPIMHVTKTNPNWIGKAKQSHCSFSRG